MKKRIGELNGKPIVIGDANLVTVHELYYAQENGGVIIYQRGANGSLEAITVAPAAPEAASEPMLTSILDEDDKDNSDTDDNITEE